MKTDDWMVTFTIPLGHDLDSPHTLDAYALRNAIEADMKAAGIPVSGAGVGFGGVDLSADVTEDQKDTIAELGEKIIWEYGLTCEVTLDHLPDDA